MNIAYPVIIFDFRNMDDEKQQVYLKEVIGWQSRRLLKEELRERMNQLLDEKRQKKSSGWLSRLLSAVCGKEGQIEYFVHTNLAFLTAPPGPYSSEYAIAVLHSSQESLKELLLQGIPDILVITTDDRQERLAGVFQQVETTRTALPTPELSDGE